MSNNAIVFLVVECVYLVGILALSFFFLILKKKDSKALNQMWYQNNLPSLLLHKS